MRKKLLLPPERSLGNQVRRCHRMFDRLLNAYLSRHELSSGFWYYLRALGMEDGVTQRHLSQVTNVTEGTTVTTIELMIKDGLVVRTRDLVDRRKLRVSLTERGRRLHDQLFHYAFEINAIAAAGITREEIEICLSVLMRMSDNLQQSFATQSGKSFYSKPKRKVPRPKSASR
ncbi:MAG: MarR family winged helix-turn-helix transcriptional regulator [Steroidobacteraceae bacterium]